MTEPRPGTLATSTPLRVEVFASFEPVAEIWRACEREFVLTPYQRLDWIRTFVESGGECGGDLAIAVLSDDRGVAALLPLVLEKARFGVRRARIVASCISNSDWMILRRDAATSLTRPVLTRALSEIARRCGGFDVLALSHQPAHWNGVANPLLAFAHGNSPSHLYCAPVSALPGPMLEHGVPRKQRKNIRRGMTGLATAHGEVRLARVRTAEELHRVHAAFLAQRGARFAEMGVENIFSHPEFIAFFRDLALKGLDEARPALAFHALYAGDHILATCCGAFAGSHYSKYMNSISDGPEARYSLTGMLMALLLDELKAEGITSMDMGVGDFGYKADWTQEQAVFDSVIPVSGLGWLAAPGLVLTRRTKRAIKQNEKLWSFAQAVRRHTYNARRRRQRPA